MSSTNRVYSFKSALLSTSPQVSSLKLSSLNHQVLHGINIPKTITNVACNYPFLSLATNDDENEDDDDIDNHDTGHNIDNDSLDDDFNDKYYDDHEWKQLNSQRYDQKQTSSRLRAAKDDLLASKDDLLAAQNSFSFSSSSTSTSMSSSTRGCRRTHINTRLPSFSNEPFSTSLTPFKTGSHKICSLRYTKIHTVEHSLFKLQTLKNISYQIFPQIIHNWFNEQLFTRLHRCKIQNRSYYHTHSSRNDTHVYNIYHAGIRYYIIIHLHCPATSTDIEHPPHQQTDQITH